MSEGITRRRAETQARLLNAAVGVFADRGVLAATVEEICDRAGFTRGAFYSNFESKDELVLALLARYRDESNAGVLQLASEAVRNTLGTSRDQAVRMATSFWMSNRTTNRDWILVMAEIRLYAAREPRILPSYLAFWDSWFTETAEALQPVIDAYQIELLIPTNEAIGLLAPVYETCMLNAAMLLPETATNIKELDPETLARVMAPLHTLLDLWIIDAGAIESEAQPTQP